MLDIFLSITWNTPGPLQTASTTFNIDRCARTRIRLSNASILPHILHTVRTCMSWVACAIIAPCCAKKNPCRLRMRRDKQYRQYPYDAIASSSSSKLTTSTFFLTAEAPIIGADRAGRSPLLFDTKSMMLLAFNRPFACSAE